MGRRISRVGLIAGVGEGGREGGEGGRGEGREGSGNSKGGGREGGKVGESEEGRNVLWGGREQIHVN